jgi:hypothetical protein
VLAFQVQGPKKKKMEKRKDIYLAHFFGRWLGSPIYLALVRELDLIKMTTYRRHHVHGLA